MGSGVWGVGSGEWDISWRVWDGYPEVGKRKLNNGSAGWVRLTGITLTILLHMVFYRGES